MKIYVVMGTMGEYSDCDMWAIGAYFDKNKADKYARQLSEIADHYYRAVDNANVELAKRTWPKEVPFFERKLYYDDHELGRLLEGLDNFEPADGCFARREYSVLEVPIFAAIKKLIVGDEE